MEESRTYTAFAGSSLVASGPLKFLLPKLKAWPGDEKHLLFVFDDQTGKQVDFDLRGTLAEVLERASPAPAPAGPGRPKLGVVSREVSLLPRHWTWLEQQPNGASAALRRLIDDARKTETVGDRARRVRDAAARFMSAMAGDLPGYEEATRALYAGKRERLDDLISKWPRDIRTHVRHLVQDAFPAAA
jgi:hypothetical protein